MRFARKLLREKRGTAPDDIFSLCLEGVSEEMDVHP